MVVLLKKTGNTFYFTKLLSIAVFVALIASYLLAGLHLGVGVCSGGIIHV